MPEEIAILIADDHPIFRGGLRALIETEPGFKLAGEAVDGEQAVALTRQLKPHILLLDLAMPKLGGLDVVKELSPHPPLDTRIIILTAAIDDSQNRRSAPTGRARYYPERYRHAVAYQGSSVRR